MKKPDTPASEATRHAALCALNVLDTPAEERFDRITRIAQRNFGVRIALVSLVDTDRQWFKSRQGLDAAETPRDISFCGHAILGEDILLIPNAEEDPRFADNPLVTGGPGIRFYAGAPLRAPSGESVGTLCVIDDQPRKLRSEDLTMLRYLANLVETELAHTELRASQTGLRESEAQFRSLIESLPQQVWTARPDGTLDYVSARTSEYFGLSSEALFGMGWQNVIHPDDLAECVQRWTAALQTGAPYEIDFRLRRADGSFRWHIGMALPLRDSQGGVIKWFGTNTDITERKVAQAERDRLVAQERAARVEANEANELAAQVLESVSDAFVSLDRQWRYVYVNEQAAQIFSRQPKDLIGKHIWTEFPEGVGQHFYHAYHKAMAEQTFIFLEDYYQPYDRWFENRIYPSKEGISIFFHDITERTRAARALAVNEARLKNLIANLPGYVYRVANDSQYTPEFISEGVVDVSGYSQNEYLVNGTVTCGTQIHPEDRDRVWQVVQEAVSARDYYECEYRIHTKSGAVKWVWARGRGNYSATGELDTLEGFVMDISDRKRAEEARASLEAQLRESQKMQAIGTLAGGIAHDFNNLVGAILGNVALIRQDLEEGHPGLARLEQVNKAGRRARSLVAQILSFSRKQPQVLVSRPLDLLVQEALGLLRAALPAGVSLEAVQGDTNLYIKADVTQLQQVLMNLCTNAWHASSGNGGHIIRVGLDATSFDAASAPRPAGLAPGRYAHVWVQDNGCGMDSATQARIFEPFYTTKPVGQGTGLGLSVAHGIVTAHSGAIAVDSVPGHGSTFHLYFPLVQPPADDMLSGWGSLEPPHGRGQHVFYVDDDEVMLLMVEQLLQRLGYRVTCFQHAQAAADAVRAHPASVDLVVTDFNMPEYSGIQLAQELGCIKPGLPVVIISGYVSDELRTSVMRAGVRGVVQKENAVEELGALVNSVLS